MSIVKVVRLWLDYFIDYLFHLYYKNKKQIVSPITNPILLDSATSLATKIRTRVISSVEVVQAHIDRIKEVNPLINAVVDERFEEALKEAHKIDDDIKNGRITEDEFKEKYFLGVPFTSKESSLCEGMRATFGLLGRRFTVANQDADIIKFTKNTGAILLGVTNVPQLNLWFETHNPVYGITRNPYDSTRSVGGSSGGESALIAACGSPLGIGTDIGGSIRIPASMCGLYGHKCTAGLTSTKGMTFRDGSNGDKTMVVAGPIVRHVEDIIPGIKAILGPKHVELDLDRPVDVSKLKIYFTLEIGDLRCSTVRPEVKDAVKRAVALLAESCYSEEINLEGFNSSMNLFSYWLMKEGANFKFDVTNRQRTPNTVIEIVKYFSCFNREFSFSSIMNMINITFFPKMNDSLAQNTTDKLKSQLIEILGTDGVLIFPSMPMPASHHHVTYLRPFNSAYFGIFNVLKFPVTQVPMGLNHEGLPLGIQIVGAPNQDRLCVAVAQEIAQKCGGFVPPFSLSK